MDLAEKCMDDFNKELNPLIKQRKVEVRENKRKNLLTADHFIRYGRSAYHQKLLNAHLKPSSQTFTKQFAINFRDYLISAMVIGNGLRASNIIELTVEDLYNVSKSDEYEGHKIITNKRYKTSTIYEEKFIVISNQLYDQLKFYEAHLRPLFQISSHHLIVATCGSASLSQSNVTCSITASFKSANVLKKDEYERVSCT